MTAPRNDRDPRVGDLVDLGRGDAFTWRVTEVKPDRICWVVNGRGEHTSFIYRFADGEWNRVISWRTPCAH